MVRGVSFTNICELDLELTSEETRLLAGGSLAVATLAYNTELAKPEAEIESGRIATLTGILYALPRIIASLPVGDVSPATVYGVDWHVVCDHANAAWIIAGAVSHSPEMSAAREALGAITREIARSRDPRFSPSAKQPGIAGKVLVGMGGIVIASVIIWAIVANLKKAPARPDLPPPKRHRRTS